MKKKLKSFTIIMLTLFIIINLFTNFNNIKNTINFSISLWFYNIVPSLFPFFILSYFLINIGIVDFLKTIFQNLMQKIFKVNAAGSFVFIMSILSGAPSNAKYINDLLQKNEINNNDANKLLYFTCFVNPLFIINIVGSSNLKSYKLGILIYITLLISNIITGFLFRNIYKNKYDKKEINIKKSLSLLNYNINNSSNTKILFNGIRESINTLINILGIITICLIFLTILLNNIKISPLNKTILTGLIEITSGLKYLSLLNISIKYKTILSGAFICFGGISIHLQILSILNKYKINYYPFFLSRIIASCIMIILLLAYFYMV